jgi:hypothetical protein
VPTGAISKAQQEALSDGKITYAEYQAGWRRYVECDAKAGYRIINITETNEVYQGGVPATAVKSGIDTTCYDREFKQVDIIWQNLRANTSPDAAAYRACLLSKHVTPATTEQAMYFQLLKLKIDPNKCINEHQ